MKLKSLYPLVLAAFAFGASASARDLASIKKAGTLIVATEPTYPPFTYTQGKNIVGFEAELAELLAKQLGVKVQWKTSSFDTLLIGLGQGRYDMVIASHGITPERQKAVDFANPHYCSGGVVLSKTGGPKTVAELKGKKVAVQLGTTYATRARSLPGLGSVQTYPNNTDALQALMAGRTEAFITDRFVALEARKKTGGKVQVGQLIFQEKIGIALQKGNKTLVAGINEALKKVQSDGSYKKLSEKYFGEDIRCK